jgi:hypothetical protein
LLLLSALHPVLFSSSFSHFFFFFFFFFFSTGRSPMFYVFEVL